ncbi:hypothetical protein NDU88_000546 [Pleurodeles waltl]|uniref:Uncharacterized protein n=1 Tax=Pleurodeles waltl TaxID=8319 RepID=A0AAV7V8P8_PLEWA|nr:hypothetical protein NDU88_000546 [Pleurodeles waltl]
MLLLAKRRVAIHWGRDLAPREKDWLGCGPPPGDTTKINKYDSKKFIEYYYLKSPPTRYISQDTFSIAILRIIHLISIEHTAGYMYAAQKHGYINVVIQKKDTF